MCTSFVLFTDRSYIGMNFDISERPILLSLKGDSQLMVYQKDGGAFLPAFGYHRSGAFMNLLMVDEIEAGKYQRGKACVHIIRLFDSVLDGSLQADELEKLIAEKKVVNVPKLSVHSMVTLPGRHAWVVEPGRGNIHLDPRKQDFLVLTNFPVSDYAGVPYSKVSGGGSDRYQVCWRMLEESRPAFSLERGFEVLEAVAQEGGDWPTQLSMLAVVEEAAVYFAVKRNFKHLFKFSFSDRLVQVEGSSAEANGQVLGQKGLLLDQLAQLASLKEGIIAEGN